MTRRTTEARRRSRSRGVAAIETALCTCALLGCVLLPAMRSMRSSGKTVSNQSEVAYDAMLKQAQ
jgi:hypothetical protein